MRTTRTLLAGALLALLLTSCGISRGPIRTEVVDVAVETTVPLRAELVAPELAPPRPPLACIDVVGRPTLCNSDMANWLNAYDQALQNINRRVAEIRGLQPPK